MGFFARFMSGAKTDSVSDRDPTRDFWYQPVSAPVSAGVVVNIETAITVPTVRNCLKVLSETIGTLPIAVFERKQNGDREKAPDHPANSLFSSPGDGRTTTEFLEQLVWDLASSGNAYFEKVLKGRQVVGLIRIEPGTLTVERLQDRSIRYKVREPGQSERTLYHDDVWHIPVPPFVNGLIGRSPIHDGREAIGAALALQKYGSSFFRNNATPPFVIKHKGNMKDKESRQNFMNAINRWWGGNNIHKPGLLEYGMELQQLGVTNEQSQFLETRKEVAVDISRIWRMPPHKVGILDKATYSNIEQQSLEYVTDTLLPWVRLIEKSIGTHLLFSDRYFFEFNVAGILRGDIKTRYEAYSRAINWGWMNVNEVRKLENLNTLGEAGEHYLQPLNMQRSDEDATGFSEGRKSAGRLNGSAHLITSQDQDGYNGS